MLRREETGGGGVGEREGEREEGRREGGGREEGGRKGRTGGKLGREGRNGHQKRITRKRESKTIRI